MTRSSWPRCRRRGLGDRDETSGAPDAWLDEAPVLAPRTDERDPAEARLAMMTPPPLLEAAREVLDRASVWRLPEHIALRTCSAEDLDRLRFPCSDRT
jgi:hypothetical protein